ncbi:MAG: penicillin-binding protein activator LpoB [Deltaproteobacteria bacterium]|jgi:uncharacterized protein (TIGR02722 family)|nr:penicillin-binding protein activator LpoB [Deltaproteobacteria bacterium]
MSGTITLWRGLAFGALLSLALSAAGCGGPNVEYGDPGAVETVTSAWGSTDLQGTAEKMAQSLLDSRYIAQAQAQPKVRLREVNNQTDEHIDTKAITDKIRIKLLQSGRVRFLADNANLNQVFAERDLTEALTRRGENKLLADTDYIVTGTVRSIRKVTKKAADVYYLITLELVDPQSAEIVWADEQEIRKTSSNPKVGW